MNNFETETIKNQSDKLNKSSEELKNTINKIKNELQTINDIISSKDSEISKNIKYEIDKLNNISTNDIEQITCLSKLMNNWATESNNIEQDIAHSINNLNKNSERIQKMINVIDE